MLPKAFDVVGDEYFNSLMFPSQECTNILQSLWKMDSIAIAQCSVQEWVFTWNTTGHDLWIIKNFWHENFFPYFFTWKLFISIILWCMFHNYIVTQKFDNYMYSKMLLFLTLAPTSSHRARSECRGTVSPPRPYKTWHSWDETEVARASQPPSVSVVCPIDLWTFGGTSSRRRAVRHHGYEPCRPLRTTPPPFSRGHRNIVQSRTCASVSRRKDSKNLWNFVIKNKSVTTQQRWHPKYKSLEHLMDVYM